MANGGVSLRIPGCNTWPCLQLQAAANNACILAEGPSSLTAVPGPQERNHSASQARPHFRLRRHVTAETLQRYSDAEDRASVDAAITAGLRYSACTSVRTSAFMQAAVQPGAYVLSMRLGDVIVQPPMTWHAVLTRCRQDTLPGDQWSMVGGVALAQKTPAATRASWRFPGSAASGQRTALTGDAECFGDEAESALGALAPRAQVRQERSAGSAALGISSGPTGRPSASSCSIIHKRDEVCQARARPSFGQGVSCQAAGAECQRALTVAPRAHGQQGSQHRSASFLYLHHSRVMHALVLTAACAALSRPHGNAHLCVLPALSTSNASFASS